MIEKIQLELTTICNLNCEYCLRPKKFSKIDKSVVERINGLAKKFVLYGYGEPLLHEDVLKIVSSLDGKIAISTNGMVDERFFEVSEAVDEFGISLDINESLRLGMNIEKIFRKMERLKGKGIAEVVLTSENLEEFSSLAEKIALSGFNIMATNFIASSKELYSKTLYFEGSRLNADFLHIDEDFFLKMLKGEEKELSGVLKLNFCAILEAKERIKVAKRSEKALEEAEEIAKSYGVNFIKPEFFGEAENRECPYRDSIFIRADSFISPCMSLAYTHNEFVNRRDNIVEEFILGNLSDEIEKIVENKREFEKLRAEMDFPWCGDCGYSTGCWFLDNGMDCYGNKPSCAQCLYSVGIVKCLI
ncbi:MAG: radical SAM protein [Archaeoglobaceae archaeon]|nr:radical SAM protein [Archaeoglobaceae archaeon]MDW8118968.1 radical SAM/SPASM domain-containing protein [Archaeoglobaceae archaeon]